MCRKTLFGTLTSAFVQDACEARAENPKLRKTQTRYSTINVFGSTNCIEILRITECRNAVIY